MMGPDVGLGQDTIDAPIPNPAPVLTDDPMEGANKSNTAKVAAAIKPMIRISSGCMLRPGMK